MARSGRKFNLPQLTSTRNTLTTCTVLSKGVSLCRNLKCVNINIFPPFRAYRWHCVRLRALKTRHKFHIEWGGRIIRRVAVPRAVCCRGNSLLRGKYLSSLTHLALSVCSFFPCALRLS